MAARAKSESFASAQAKLGVVQRGKLTDGIKEAYRRRAQASEPYPDLREVNSIVSEIYAQENRKPDSLTEVLRDLSDFGLFWEHDSQEPILDSLVTNTLIVDLSGLAMLRELVAYLVIEGLYREMTQLPDSEISDPLRALRTVLVIDEAHHYLGQNNPFLQWVIREGRAKGVAVFLASQSPSDYAHGGSDFNYLEHIEFPLVFTADGVSARIARDLLGCSQGAAAALPTEIAHLKTFEFVAKSETAPKGYAVCEAHPFYEAYGG